MLNIQNAYLHVLAKYNGRSNGKRFLLINPGGNYLILLIEITHGASFAFQWAAGIELTQQLAHPKYVQTFIGIFCSLSNNAGGIIGNTIGGFVYEFYGYYYMWGICLIVLIVSFVFFSISLKIRK